MVEKYLILAVILFSIGVAGAISRRNIIIIYICIELMLNAINLALVGISGYLQEGSAQIIALMIIAIAAAEAALFMALFVLLFKQRGSLDSDLFAVLRSNHDA